MTTTTQAQDPAVHCPKIDHVREWKIYSFLVSALAVALAIEVVRLRSMV